MPPAKKKLTYQARVNLSHGTVTVENGQRIERAKLIHKGKTVELTEQEAANYGRFVRLVETPEDVKPIGRMRPKDVVGGDVDKSGSTLRGTAALDMKDETRVYNSESDDDEAAQPTNNPVDPSFTGE
jgi:hypothetical protein